MANSPELYKVVARGIPLQAGISAALDHRALRGDSYEVVDIRIHKGGIDMKRLPVYAGIVGMLVMSGCDILSLNVVRVSLINNS